MKANLQQVLSERSLKGSKPQPKTVSKKRAIAEFKQGGYAAFVQVGEFFQGLRWTPCDCHVFDGKSQHQVNITQALKWLKQMVESNTCLHGAVALQFGWQMANLLRDSAGLIDFYSFKHGNRNS